MAEGERASECTVSSKSRDRGKQQSEEAKNGSHENAPCKLPERRRKNTGKQRQDTWTKDTCTLNERPLNLWTVFPEECAISSTRALTHTLASVLGIHIRRDSLWTLRVMETRENREGAKLRQELSLYASSNCRFFVRPSLEWHRQSKRWLIALFYSVRGSALDFECIHFLFASEKVHFNLPLPSPWLFLLSLSSLLAFRQWQLLTLQSTALIFNCQWKNPSAISLLFLRQPSTEVRNSQMHLLIVCTHLILCMD